jgi:uncharacterized RDD family membrane protein YckC
LSSGPRLAPVSRLDTSLESETPEGIVLTLRPAGLPARCWAFALDWLIRIMVIGAASTAAQLMGGVGVAFYLILLFALEWLYPVAFELGRSGATPGKAIMGIKVVMDTGLPVTPAASLTRNLLRAADFMPFGYAFGLVCMLMRQDFRRLGDIAAATLVVHRPRTLRQAELPQVEPVTPALQLGLGEQATIIALAARARRMTVERLDELAAIAAPVSGDAGHAGPAVTQRVLGVAQWLMGRRT